MEGQHWARISAPRVSVVMAVLLALAAVIGRGLPAGAARPGYAGDLDPSFGQGGWVQDPWTVPVGAAARAVLVTPDGKYLVGGEMETGGDNDFWLARFNADGSVDPSFGHGGQMAVTATWAQFGGLALQADGKVVFAGQDDSGVATLVVGRRTAGGALDPSFARRACCARSWTTARGRGRYWCSLMGASSWPGPRPRPATRPRSSSCCGC